MVGYAENRITFPKSRFTRNRWLTGTSGASGVVTRRLRVCASCSVYEAPNDTPMEFPGSNAASMPNSTSVWPSPVPMSTKLSADDGRPVGSRIVVVSTARVVAFINTPNRAPISISPNLVWRLKPMGRAMKSGPASKTLLMSFALSLPVGSGRVAVTGEAPRACSSNAIAGIFASTAVPAADVASGAKATASAPAPRPVRANKLPRSVVARVTTPRARSHPGPVGQPKFPAAIIASISEIAAESWLIRAAASAALVASP